MPSFVTSWRWGMEKEVKLEFVHGMRISTATTDMGVSHWIKLQFNILTSQRRTKAFLTPWTTDRTYTHGAVASTQQMLPRSITCQCMRPFLDVNEVLWGLNCRAPPTLFFTWSVSLSHPRSHLSSSHKLPAHSTLLHGHQLTLHRPLCTRWAGWRTASHLPVPVIQYRHIHITPQLMAHK